MSLDDGGSDCQLGVVEDCPVVLVEGGLLRLAASEGDCGLSCGLVGHFDSRNQFIFCHIGENKLPSWLHTIRGLKKPKNGQFVCFLVRPPSVRFLRTVPFSPEA